MVLYIIKNLLPIKDITKNLLPIKDILKTLPTTGIKNYIKIQKDSVLKKLLQYCIYRTLSLV